MTVLRVLFALALFASVSNAAAASQAHSCEALIEAVQGVNWAVIEHQLGRTDPNCTVPMEGSPLIAAARSGALPVVRHLVKAGADVDLGVPGDGSPLIAAAGAGWTHIVAYLIEEGADVNVLVEGDETPLINAAAEGSLAVVQMLVEAGADVNQSAWGGDSAAPELRTPLSMAQRFGHDQVVAYLVAQGAKG